MPDGTFTGAATSPKLETLPRKRLFGHSSYLRVPGIGNRLYCQDAYPTIHQKAAALLQSVVSNHALIDGNKRLGLAAVIVFYGVNGYELTLDNDGAYALIIDLAVGQLTDVQDIAARLERGVSTS